VWDLARGCMHTYKILKARAQAFGGDPEVKDLLAGQASPELDSVLRNYTADEAAKLPALGADLKTLGRLGLGCERLDQITMKCLSGAAGLPSVRFEKPTCHSTGIL
jgi:xylose isomerase